MAGQLANLIYSAREGTLLKAIELALSGHGITLRDSKEVGGTPTIIFNINSSNEQHTHMMFAPVRDVKSIQEMRMLDVNAPD